MKLGALRFLTVAAVAALSAAACGDGDRDGDAEGAGAAGAPAALDGDLTVFAAASLTDVFDEIGAAFEEANPGVGVELNYGPSSGLREQILEGAPADVFASANPSNMDQVVEAGAAGAPEVFATNVLQIVVPAGNPGGITGLDDFADPDLLIGLCAEEVPCGDLGRAALAAAGVTPEADTDEADVRALLTKVGSGDLDAGIVYRTDVRAAGGAVEGVDIPAEGNVTATYPIAALTDAGDAGLAEAFVAFVLSGEGREVLAGHGFGRP
jgi:molybdate transport system substrate-binding protein